VARARDEGEDVGSRECFEEVGFRRAVLSFWRRAAARAATARGAKQGGGGADAPVVVLRLCAESRACRAQGGGLYRRAAPRVPGAHAEPLAVAVSAGPGLWPLAQMGSAWVAAGPAEGGWVGPSGSAQLDRIGFFFFFFSETFSVQKNSRETPVIHLKH
jgi:hypothetical protein